MGPPTEFPTGRGTGIVYYRKDLFAAAKVSIPKTWDEFLAAAEKLNQPGKVYGVVQRGKPGVHVEQDFLRYLHSTGHGVLSADNKTCLLDRADSIKMLEIFGKPFQSGWSPPRHAGLGAGRIPHSHDAGPRGHGGVLLPYWGPDDQPQEVQDGRQAGLVPRPLDGREEPRRHPERRLVPHHG